MSDSTASDLTVQTSLAKSKANAEKATRDRDLSKPCLLDPMQQDTSLGYSHPKLNRPIRIIQSVALCDSQKVDLPECLNSTTLVSKVKRFVPCFNQPCSCFLKALSQAVALRCVCEWTVHDTELGPSWSLCEMHQMAQKKISMSGYALKSC